MSDDDRDGEMMTESESLADALPREQARCRELLTEYERIPQGAFGAMMIRRALKEAEEAATSGDVVRMLGAYQTLERIEG